MVACDGCVGLVDQLINPSTFSMTAVYKYLHSTGVCLSTSVHNRHLGRSICCYRCAC